MNSMAKGCDSSKARNGREGWTREIVMQSIECVIAVSSWEGKGDWCFYGGLSFVRAPLCGST